MLSNIFTWVIEISIIKAYLMFCADFDKLINTFQWFKILMLSCYLLDLECFFLDVMIQKTGKIKHILNLVEKNLI